MTSSAQASSVSGFGDLELIRWTAAWRTRPSEQALSKAGAGLCVIVRRRSASAQVQRSKKITSY